ncbi:UvrD-helicase domain-containing protein [Chryseobacterium sp. KMC2]|uniref:UvrD-helicase domain-containing protein n=1 Tax=Chryseobacterium sp. KMC2 TaxID=2800705 RepID=UPI0019249C20|nr:ATP-dependent helicase [Chryseobacterium sp. KMC2]MBL3547225.1 ATP-dependent helicase [Chryseobacterium sp. KMC2]
MSVIEIDSDTSLTNVDTHFKVSAGPGAGKTYWIVNHIKNILSNSDKLAKTRKILCITYTNIATETILKRLGNASVQVEISTIHSFLYNHILKPYASFIASDYDLNVSQIDGHDDIILSNYSFLNNWKARTRQQRLNDDKIIIKAFNNLKWKFNDEGELVAKTDYPFTIGGYPIRNDSYMEYKKMAWEKGVIHHDDVLFLSYQIIKKFPFVSSVISAKFPYILVDEFQDSNPIQVEILKELANLSKIGIIGDVAQSIYEFQGADSEQFNSFNLPSQQNFFLLHNRRSSNEIIDFLNSIRTDITQQYYRNITVDSPTLLVGDMVSALQQSKSDCDGDIYTLSYKNITSNALKAELNGTGINDNLLEELRYNDSNKDRVNLIYTCVKAIAYTKESKFKDALNTFEKYFNFKSDKIKGRKKALKYISILMENYETYKTYSLLEFSNFIKDNIDTTLVKVSRGAVKTHYENHTFEQFYLCVKIPEDKSFHKTIHKAKGDEFDNVLLILTDENDLKFITESNLQHDEKHRIRYVAVSRARDRLFISVPSLDSALETQLSTNYNFNIVRL